MSRFFTLCCISGAERLELVAGVERVLRSALGGIGDLPLFNPSEDYRSRASNLLDLGRELFAKAEGKRQTLLLLLILLEAEGCRVADLEGAVSTAAARVRRYLLQLPFTTVMVEASLCDARLSHLQIRGNAVVILTSPPYINVFNYHQNHRALLELLGFDLLHVAASEIGSNRKNRQNRFRTVVQYALDMEQCLESFALSLATGGRLILVVGRESNVRGLSIPNSGLVRAIADLLGVFEHENTFERRFTNRFGTSIYEDILVLRRTNSKPVTGGARASALGILEEISARADGEVLADVRGAIADVPVIHPSPLFTRSPQL